MKRTVILMGIGLGLAGWGWWSLGAKDSSLDPASDPSVDPLPASQTRPPIQAIKTAQAPKALPSESTSTETSTSNDPSPSSETRTDDDPAAILERLIAMRAIKSQVQVSEFLDQNAALAKEKVEEYCKEAEELPPLPVEEPPPGLLDASEFMRPRADWYEPERQGSLHLPKEIQNRLNQAQGNWLSALTPSDYVGRDFSWMKELAQFGTWDLMNGPAAGEGQNSLAIELPDYLLLMTWARLRMANALVNGDLQEASAEVRHLSRLLFTQKIMLGEMVSIVMLEIERQAYDAAVARGLAVNFDPPPPVDLLQRQRKQERVSSAFFWPGVDPEVMKTAMECTRNRCMALHEAAWFETSVGSLSPNVTSETFWSLFEQEGCSQPYANRLRDNRSMTLERAASMFNGKGPLENWPPPAPNSP